MFVKDQNCSTECGDNEVCVEIEKNLPFGCECNDGYSNSTGSGCQGKILSLTKTFYVLFQCIN